MGLLYTHPKWVGAENALHGYGFGIVSEYNADPYKPVQQYAWYNCKAYDT